AAVFGTAIPWFQSRRPSHKSVSKFKILLILLTVSQGGNPQLSSNSLNVHLDVGPQRVVSV
ncbi:hypothetical protein, partial [Brucella abortus]|uniref:hypothetical protein n=1 Tax=Brucella abortus TaxID=235 RepID=UPI0031FDDF89